MGEASVRTVADHVGLPARSLARPPPLVRGSWCGRRLVVTVLGGRVRCVALPVDQTIRLLAVRPSDDHGQGHTVPMGMQMTDSLIADRPFIVHKVSRWPRRERRPSGSFEVRPAPLRVATYFLGSDVADLERVRDAHRRPQPMHPPIDERPAA